MSHFSASSVVRVADTDNPLLINRHMAKPKNIQPDDVGLLKFRKLFESIPVGI